MTAKQNASYSNFNQSGYCATMAAAGTSMRSVMIMDTAIIAVSILIISVVNMIAVHL